MKICNCLVKYLLKEFTLYKMYIIIIIITTTTIIIIIIIDKMAFIYNDVLNETLFTNFIN